MRLRVASPVPNYAARQGRLATKLALCQNGTGFTARNFFAFLTFYLRIACYVWVAARGRHGAGPVPRIGKGLHKARARRGGRLKAVRLACGKYLGT
jgi:hypothetical protein